MTRHILLYFHQLMSRDITCDSENFTHIFGRKQKLQLSKKCDLQLNTRYYCNCYT